MTSSIQVFNLLHNLQEDNLQVLEIFTEYGRLALEETDEKPFQKLFFLIRDWSFPYEHPYGLAGGQKLLDKKLALKENQPQQLQRVRRHIRGCFSDTALFLMPHPGRKVSTNPNFDGRLRDIDPEFVSELKILVPLLLDPDNIVLKEIGGQKVTGRQLMEYFKVYINIFKGESMPEPKSMLEATAEANNLAAVALGKDLYMKSMEEICGGNKAFLNPRLLEERHQECVEESLESFHKTRKMGGKEYSETYLHRLETEIGEAYEHFAAQNKAKNMFSLFGSPAVLLLWCLVCYLCSRFFELLGLLAMANLFFLFGSASLGITLAYMFCRYGGNWPEFVQAMDAMAEFVWSYILDLSYQAMQNAVKNRTRNAFGNNSTLSSPLSSPSTTRQKSKS